MFIAFGGSVYAWTSKQIIALVVCSGVLWLAFIAQQAFSFLTTRENRLFPVELIRSWEMNILFVQMASAQAMVNVPIYFLPIFFQFSRQASVLHSAVDLLPFILVLVFAVMFNGAMMTQLGYYMPWYLIGATIALVGSALMHTIDLEMSTARLYGYSVLIGLGVGLYSQAGLPVAQVKATPQQLSQAVAFIGVGQVGGIALTLVISNSIFLNQATSRIARILPDELRTVVQQAISGVRSSFFDQLSQADRTRVLTAIAESISDVFIMMIAAAALSVFLSFFMKPEKLFVQPSTTKA